MFLSVSFLGVFSSAPSSPLRRMLRPAGSGHWKDTARSLISAPSSGEEVARISCISVVPVSLMVASPAVCACAVAARLKKMMVDTILFIYSVI